MSIQLIAAVVIFILTFLTFRYDYYFEERNARIAAKVFWSIMSVVGLLALFI